MTLSLDPFQCVFVVVVNPLLGWVFANYIKLSHNKITYFNISLDVSLFFPFCKKINSTINFQIMLSTTTDVCIKLIIFFTCSYNKYRQLCSVCVFLFCLLSCCLTLLSVQSGSLNFTQVKSIACFTYKKNYRLSCPLYFHWAASTCPKWGFRGSDLVTIRNKLGVKMQFVFGFVGVHSVLMIDPAVV